jgi:hypothetical protein
MNMRETNEIRELTAAELAEVAGGAEAQIFKLLSDAVNEVLKNIGGALQTAARAG